MINRERYCECALARAFQPGLWEVSCFTSWCWGGRIKFQVNSFRLNLNRLHTYSEHPCLSNIESPVFILYSLCNEHAPSVACCRGLFLMFIVLRWAQTEQQRQVGGGCSWMHLVGRCPYAFGKKDERKTHASMHTFLQYAHVHPSTAASFHVAAAQSLHVEQLVCDILASNREKKPHLAPHLLQRWAVKINSGPRMQGREKDARRKVSQNVTSSRHQSYLTNKAAVRFRRQGRPQKQLTFAPNKHSRRGQRCRHYFDVSAFGWSLLCMLVAGT